MTKGKTLGKKGLQVNPAQLLRFLTGTPTPLEVTCSQSLKSWRLRDLISSRRIGHLSQTWSRILTTAGISTASFALSFILASCTLRNWPPNSWIKFQNQKLMSEIWSWLTRSNPSSKSNLSLSMKTGRKDSSLWGHGSSSWGIRRLIQRRNSRWSWSISLRLKAKLISRKWEKCMRIWTGNGLRQDSWLRDCLKNATTPEHMLLKFTSWRVS